MAPTNPINSDDAEGVVGQKKFTARGVRRSRLRSRADNAGYILRQHSQPYGQQVVVGGVCGNERACQVCRATSYCLSFGIDHAGLHRGETIGGGAGAGGGLEYLRRLTVDEASPGNRNIVPTHGSTTRLPLAPYRSAGGGSKPISRPFETKPRLARALFFSYSIVALAFNRNRIFRKPPLPRPPICIFNKSSLMHCL